MFCILIAELFLQTNKHLICFQYSESAVYCQRKYPRLTRSAMPHKPHPSNTHKAALVPTAVAAMPHKPYPSDTHKGQYRLNKRNGGRNTAKNLSVALEFEPGLFCFS